MHGLYQCPASPDCLLVSNRPENSRDFSERATAGQVISKWIPQRWGGVCVENVAKEGLHRDLVLSRSGLLFGHRVGLRQ